MRTRPTPSGYFRRAAKSTDGRLWFAVFDGVAMVDPKHLPENLLPPPVQIQQVTADHTAYPIAPHLRLPPLTRELQIDYTAFSFVSPEEVRFRYRLDSFDRDWNDVGGRRQAVYTNLPPGQYRFRVIACNNDGVWSKTGASYEFTIQPAIYQTNWFRFLCVAALAILLWGLYRLRLRQIAARLRMRYEERLAERTRIARELHDTLIQNIAGFALQLDGLSKTVTAPWPAKDRLRDLRQQAEEWLHEARLSVWDLRSPSLEGQDLLAALRKSGEQITSGKRVQFQMTVTGKRRPSSAILEEQLLRIVQETTRNAVRHGQPNKIEIHVSYQDEDVIRVRIRDDGCGFDLEEASRKMGHWGIATMRERANKIGAELNISSESGRGTEVEIVAPIVSRLGSGQ
jgi:signal transduction histidine kinase